MNAPDLSVIIPVYNRGDVIRYTLESVRQGSGNLKVETIIVDDGSTPATAETLDRLGYVPSRLVRQSNQGLLFARLTGLAAATGRHVLFLDSDDLVSADKLTAQVIAMDRTAADISYTDTARCVLTGDYRSLAISPDPPLSATSDAADFFISVQPAPHSPVFRRVYLEEIVRHAFFPPSPLYNSVAEIWFYHNAAPRPARVVHVPGPRAIIGAHPDARLTNHWERLGIASLAVMEAFARHCPANTPAARRARQLVGEKAFGSWRRLPRGFSPAFANRTLALWRKLAAQSAASTPKALAPGLGGSIFRKLALVLGPVAAARLLHRFQAGPYESCRTMTDAEFTQLLSAIPPA